MCIPLHPLLATNEVIFVRPNGTMGSVVAVDIMEEAIKAVAVAHTATVAAVVVDHQVVATVAAVAGESPHH